MVTLDMTKLKEKVSISETHKFEYNEESEAAIADFIRRIVCDSVKSSPTTDVVVPSIMDACRATILLDSLSNGSIWKVKPEEGSTEKNVEITLKSVEDIPEGKIRIYIQWPNNVSVDKVISVDKLTELYSIISSGEESNAEEKII